MVSTKACQDPSCHYCLGISPNATSSPIPIPGSSAPERYPIPFILHDDSDSTPGVVHIPTPNITDYTPCHYPKTAKPSNTPFEKTNPIRLGVKAPPGSGPKPPPRKEVKIVRDEILLHVNKREQSQWLWERTQMLEERKGMRKAAQRIMAEETRGHGEGEENWNERRNDLGVDSAISFVFLGAVKRPYGVLA